MAAIQTNRSIGAHSDSSFGWLHQKIDQAKSALARRRAYRKTFDELSTLTNRELNDLGIARYDFHRLALEAADEH